MTEIKNTKKIKILIAEDEQALTKAMTLKFTGAGFDVESVGNGQEALVALEKTAFDFVILDLIMPILDGYHVLEEMKKRGIKIPVIVLSNLGQDEDIRKVKALGAKDFFIKAATPLSELVAIVKKQLGI